jgi:hypothetical protein
LSGVAPKRDNFAANRIEVVRITIKLEGGPEGTTIVQAKVQTPDVGEKKRKSGNNFFFGW